MLSRIPWLGEFVDANGNAFSSIHGDLAHHPLQFAFPDVLMPGADTDVPMAVATRRRSSARTRGTHVGRIKPDGEAWRFDEF